MIMRELGGDWELVRDWQSRNRIEKESATIEPQPQALAVD
jgi:hypothetical protein